MSTVAVTTWYLEQTSPADAGPPVPAPSGVRVRCAEIVSPELSHFLYTAVGQDVRWTDRLGWDRARWATELEGTRTWVAYERGTPAGYAELAPRADGSVEIVYFGLLPAFRGRRIGAHLLSYATARAWELAAPGGRVWLHTCSDDGPHARANYERRGFRVYRTEVDEEEQETAPHSSL
ncbi:GNAT family N-acetyltransferase [Streptomyces sp. SPB074]|uniref:GNAT family N-acetyltransferase n=1 Tax=Streptomyces sp. (strain SPB074) TaxID=465543 RepID=UPI00017F14A7|nr:GNAT family N-acetyltransferase [Streptomyces sp. SPB074]EDY46807.1 GNAT family acetyltransferase [Streptomyces sp. SPB074]